MEKVQNITLMEVENKANGKRVNILANEIKLDNDMYLNVIIKACWQLFYKSHLKVHYSNIMM
jgi:hypothetical protein